MTYSYYLSENSFLSRFSATAGGCGGGGRSDNLKIKQTQSKEGSAGAELGNFLIGGMGQNNTQTNMVATDKSVRGKYWGK